MNTVLDEAEEIYQKKGIRRKLGRIVLKGDNISLICNIRYYIFVLTVFSDWTHDEYEVIVRI